MKNNILKKVLVVSALLVFIASGSVYGQAREIPKTTVKGSVVTSQDQPLKGIVVKSFNTNQTAVTDALGNFEIAVTSGETDRLSVSLEGYKVRVVEVNPGTTVIDPVVVEDFRFVSADNTIAMPYRDIASDRTVSAVTTITGDELMSYPAASLLEALSGRLPGLTIEPYSTVPGHESFGAFIRGTGATIYIDGIMRDITGLSASEVEEVQVIRDLSGRAVLGLSGSGPVIWITTRKGTSFNREMKVSAEYGLSTPATLPKYLDSYNYANLLNEALENDGYDAWYTPADLAAYQNGSNLLTHPDVDYYGEYVAKTAPFRRASVSFEGGDRRVTYFSMFDYVGGAGLENVGEKVTNNRYKLRGNVAIKLNDFMNLSINIAASLNKQRFPNVSSGAGVYNMFDILSVYPSNAHPIYADTLLIRSDNYPVNLTNELAHSGFGDGMILNAQNNARLVIDLGSIVEGLTAFGNASFDVSNSIINSKGGTEALYRLQGVTPVRVVERVVVPNMSLGDFDVLKRTAGYAGLNFEREFGKSSVAADAVFFAGLEEITSNDDWYQPSKVEDLSFRLNYGFDNRYVAQVDLVYSGSNRMPAGKRFSLYPTAGLAWIASNESFLSESKAVDYLKVFGSAGIMGINDYYLQGYNPFYLYETLWTLDGGWNSGVASNAGEWVDIYRLVQTGSDDFVLPKRRFINTGIQAQLFGKALDIEVNYFNERNYDKISNKGASTPSIIGSPQFLPATNYGEDMRWGIDGLVQWTKKVGDFRYSFGGNAMYMRGKYLVVDEPEALPDYQKRTGTDMDAFWLYQADGLFQTAGEITSRGVSQSWGALQPGDIRYADLNGDDVVDELDVEVTDYHSPRFFYGVNLSAGFRGLNISALGQGEADGSVMLANNRYFMINGTGQNYSELMLDRFPVTNDYPRLTTVSQNNYQYSTFWVAKAAYFRLKNVEISYTFPVTASRKLAMNDLKIYVRGTNLAAVSSLKKYSVDPENINAGITGYPLFRTITAGVSCKF
ncbi:MAG: SusC/RagA family TonB-linked outer membrane protein [Bacteroidetes bacterium]|nr:MAG: SusC/RagA family TonB-linked outer membrane protein [Bacteroidota bacterium]